MGINRVSVLVTFYNQEGYVDKAMESILSQKTSFGVKIIAGDDGSSDGTADAVRKWMQKYPDKIELYVMERGEGKQIPGFRASRNRINILKHVDTEYFIFLDGDDYFSNDSKLQKQVDILDSADNQDCIACGHNTDMLYKDNTRKPATDPSLKEGKISAADYWIRHYIHTDSLLFKSSVIPGLDLKLLENSFNDNLITFPAVKSGKIYYIPESWAVYVQTSDGIWTKGNEAVNLIRNMIFYDLAVKIAPELKKQSQCRFSYLWTDLWKIRKEIDASALEAYSAEAAEKGCANTLRWIGYRDLNAFQKAGLAIKSVAVRCYAGILRRVL